MAASKGSGASRRSEAEWREVLGRCEASGLSAREFCRREDLSLSSFQRWRARCRAASAAPFVELVAPAATEDPPAALADWSVELELPGGLRLRLRA
jgi:hypothetical protein